MRVFVRSRVNLPDARLGEVVALEDGPRVRGLIASGRLELVREMPAQLVAPRGTIAEVLAWVGGDPDRAEVALAAEIGGTAPRKTLIGKLDEIAADGAPDEDEAAHDAAYEAFEVLEGGYAGGGGSSLSEDLSESGGL
jgi:hypothetical protein